MSSAHTHTPTNQAPVVPVHPGQDPVASPAARWIGILTGIALLALAAAAGRELWLRHMDSTWSSWAKPFTHWVGTLHFQTWMLPVAGVLALVGLYLVIVTFMPRAKTHRLLIDEYQNLWMRPVDIARMSTAAAEQVTGVRHATTTVKASQVLVDIDGDPTDSTLIPRVGRAVGPLVAQVAGSPELLVKVAEDKEELS